MFPDRFKLSSQLVETSVLKFVFTDDRLHVQTETLMDFMILTSGNCKDAAQLLRASRTGPELLEEQTPGDSSGSVLIQRAHRGERRRVS